MKLCVLLYIIELKCKLEYIEYDDGYLIYINKNITMPQDLYGIDNKYMIQCYYECNVLHKIDDLILKIIDKLSQKI
jgi:hypothetical protein